MLFIFCFKNLQFSWKMLIFAIGKFYQPLLMTLSISIQVGASCANLLFSLRIGSVSVGVRWGSNGGRQCANFVDKQLLENGCGGASVGLGGKFCNLRRVRLKC